MRRFFSIIIAVCCGITLWAQTLMNKDSLLNLLSAAKEDTAKISLYLKIGKQYEINDFARAKYYYGEAGNLSRKINYTPGIIRYISFYCNILNGEGLYDSSLLLNLESVELSRKSKDSLGLGKSLFNTGVVYNAKGEFENTIKCFEEAKPLIEKFGNEVLKAMQYDFFGNIYLNTKQYNKAIEYGEKSVAAFHKINQPGHLGTALSNLAGSYGSIHNHKKSLVLFEEVLKIALQSGDIDLEENAYVNLATVHKELGEYDKTKMYYEKALLLSKKLEGHVKELNAVKGLADYYILTKQYSEAKKYAGQALGISNRYSYKAERVEILSILSKIAYATQDIQQGEKYMKQSQSLADSLLNEENLKNIVDIEKKYEAEKKETKIKQLEAEKKVQQLSIRQKSSLNNFLLAGAAGLLLISLLSYRTYIQRQKLQQQRINELETEKQLTATEAVLKGEEQERIRLAKDLHDGLGGMLSGIKYSFNTMKENLIMTPDNQQVFERSMNMLDDSIKEMRRVAHNMMPESLMRYGLDKTLGDYIAEINKTGLLKAVYQSMGLENKHIENTTAITIYRVVQELLNNAVKHAAATQVLVQLLAEGDKLIVNVEDDGKGFDTTILKQAEGIGWKNIQSRVDFLKGKLDVRSSEGKGTLVNMEFTV